LKDIDAWKYIAPRSQPYSNMQVWETYGPGMVRFSAKDIGVSELGRITEDSTIQAAIYEAIKAGGHTVDYIFDSSITALSVSRIGPNIYGPATVTITGKKAHTAAATAVNQAAPSSSSSGASGSKTVTARC
jgi:2-polyprenyl-6-methoxyphenol hydroxylase-like FAD-dependent oxidoreductase